jgi:hypothetical protein
MVALEKVADDRQIQRARGAELAPVERVNKPAR